MFRENFVWGVATAAYQIEGAVQEDGRALSIWDTHCMKDATIYNAATGEDACDFYHKYKEDIALMKKFGIKAFRMSLSWSRIIPKGIGDVNPRGIEFYNNVIDELLKNGIIPYITLLHWDLPVALYEKGGYTNKDFPNWFEYYAKVVVDSFSDRVINFMTINEPQLIVGAHKGSKKAPSIKLSDAETVPMVHNLLLAHGKAVKVMREFAHQKINIGLANQGRFFCPTISEQSCINVAERETFDYKYDNWYSSVSWYADPIFLGKYPEPMFSKLKEYLPDQWEEDMGIISQPLDFYGQNFYDSTFVDLEGKIVGEKQGAMYNAEHWLVTPDAIGYAVKWLYERYKKPIIISENGICCHDWISLDGKVHDPQRIDFLQRYLLSLRKVSETGVDLVGYFCWSFMDNFEWELGYRPRFGLVYVDYQTQNRIPKDSAYWYKRVIESNGASLDDYTQLIDRGII